MKDYNLGAVGEDRSTFAVSMEPHDAPTGPVPRTPEGKPDFSGIWHGLRTIDPGKPQRLPWAEAVVKERRASNDSPSAHCLPNPISTQTAGYYFRIMQNQTVLAFLYESNLPRQIYLDGRKHPEESLSPFIGHSVGRWDGDTLVVDTVGFNEASWLTGAGDTHTEQLHTIERFTRKDLGHLEVEMRIEDSGTFQQPWTMKFAGELGPPTEEVGQIVCTENNLDVPHTVDK
jgi:hypothetical protein